MGRGGWGKKRGGRGGGEWGGGRGIRGGGAGGGVSVGRVRGQIRVLKGKKVDNDREVGACTKDC